MNRLEQAPGPQLEAVNLTKRYDDGVLALDHVSFAIHPAQLYAILGGNGAGKTTTINLFLNLLEPTEGEARICGIASHRDPLKAKAKVAFVSENVMLYPNFTAVQNLDFFARLGGQNDYTDADYQRVLDRVGLARESHRKRLRDFSKGMRQKCGIAIAILKDAPAILLDEPTSGLDPKAGHDFLTLLRELRAEGRAILMSTHDIFRAKEVADVVAIMDKGRMIMEKKASELAGRDLEDIYMQYMAGHNGQAVPAAESDYA